MSVSSGRSGAQQCTLIYSTTHNPAYPDRPPAFAHELGQRQGKRKWQGRAACEHRYNSMPAMQADMKLASVPTNMAFNPSRARSDLREGASAPMPPICMAIELRLAKPHSAKVA